MKLISCYIENFGCLSQYKLDLRPGLTLIEEENGFGKTTLAEFIRANTAAGWFLNTTAGNTALTGPSAKSQKATPFP